MSVSDKPRTTIGARIVKEDKLLFITKEQQYAWGKGQMKHIKAEKEAKSTIMLSSNGDILIHSFNLMKSQLKSVCWGLEAFHREGNVKAMR